MKSYKKKNTYIFSAFPAVIFKSAALLETTVNNLSVLQLTTNRDNGSYRNKTA